MKTIIIAALIMYAAIGYTQTTEGEYNYILNGYKVQVIEQGGDLKKGYNLKDYGETKLNISNGSIGMDFKVLSHDSNNKAAAIMAVCKKYNKAGTVSDLEYYCIPIGDDNPLWDRTISQLNAHYNNDKGKELYEVMLMAFMRFSSKVAAK